MVDKVETISKIKLAMVHSLLQYVAILDVTNLLRVCGCAVLKQKFNNIENSLQPCQNQMAWRLAGGHKPCRWFQPNVSEQHVVRQRPVS